MSDEAASKPTITATKTRIRRAAVLGSVGAFGLWFMGMSLSLRNGKSHSQAISNGMALAIVALACWTVCRIVSRRSHSFIVFGMSMLFAMANNDTPFLTAVGTFLTFMIPFALMLGLASRISFRRGSRAANRTYFTNAHNRSDPMYDADVDQVV